MTEDDTPDVGATSVSDLISRFESLGEISAQEAAEAKAVLVNAVPDEEAAVEESTDIRTKIMGMTIPQKVKLAMFGNSVVRGLLIFDPNKMIQEFVLKNPRLTQPEVEGFLKSTTISDSVLRLVANSKEWMKSYAHKYYLVSNPKTPGDIALRWIRFLNMTDLKKLSKSKNVPNLVSTAAQRMVTAAEQKK